MDECEKLLTGTPYKLERLLGKGSRGAVYFARDTVADRCVAVKVLHNASCPNEIQRFIAEAKVLGSIEHPNVLQALDMGMDKNDQPFLVTEYLPGHTLKHLLDTGHLSSMQVIKLFVQILDGVDAAHRARISHSDLGTDKIFVVQSYEEPHARVIGWGSARRDRECEPSADVDALEVILGEMVAQSPERKKLVEVLNTKFSSVPEFRNALTRAAKGNWMHRMFG